MACKIVDTMLNKYIPQDMISMIKMRQALSAVSMTIDEDLTILFETLIGIWNCYTTLAYQVLDKELIANVLDKAPLEYRTVLSCKMCSQGANLELSHFQDAMNQLWWAPFSKCDNDSKDMSLVSCNLDSSQMATCYCCGSWATRLLNVASSVLIESRVGLMASVTHVTRLAIRL